MYSNASKDDIILGSGDSKNRVPSSNTREVILSHRNIHETKSSKRNKDKPSGRNFLQKMINSSKEDSIETLKTPFLGDYE